MGVGSGRTESRARVRGRLCRAGARVAAWWGAPCSGKGCSWGPQAWEGPETHEEPGPLWGLG